MTADVIVCGLGAMGSSAAYHLAAGGARVLGFDRFAPPHTLGSSHGKTRIIREAYFEDPLYVPLIQRAYECWDLLERASGRALLTRTGGLMIGSPMSAVVSGAQASAVRHRLEHERLADGALKARTPAFTFDAGTVAIWEPRAGVLQPEAAIDTQLTLARKLGAELHANEPVLSWSANADGVEVTTAQGRYSAGHLVIAVGAWATQLLGQLSLPLRVERTVAYWFDALEPALFTAERFPIFIHEFAPGRSWYGFPDLGDGVKVALHHQGATVEPDSISRIVGDDEIAFVRSLLERYLPAANGSLRETAVCMYTNTPDDHFILDRHPVSERVIVASPCSGHGFKFSSVIGEIIAEMATGRPHAFDLAPFRLSRFQ